MISRHSTAAALSSFDRLRDSPCVDRAMPDDPATLATIDSFSFTYEAAKNVIRNLPGYSRSDVADQELHAIMHEVAAGAMELGSLSRLQMRTLLSALNEYEAARMFE